jgi:hypothetical protein
MPSIGAKAAGSPLAKLKMSLAECGEKARSFLTADDSDEDGVEIDFDDD